MKTRLTLEFPARTGVLLESLMDRMGATSKAEVLRKALALLDATVTAHEQGKRVGAVDAGQPLAIEFIGI